ncbi:unnamed protein product [Rhodiola kirilowii]
MTQKNNCFFKVMIGNFTKTIRIPPLFVTEFSGQFPQEIMLSCGEVRLWRIHVVKGDQGYLYFDLGWSVFVQDNGLELGDFLVFRYTEKLRFDVEIFEPSGCLKEITVGRPRSSQCVRNRDSSDSDSDSEPGSGGGLKGCMRSGPVPKPVLGLAAVQATKGTSVSKTHSEQLASMPRTYKSVSVKDSSVMKGSETPNAMPKPVSGLAAVQATKGTSVSKTHSEQLASMPRTHKSVSVKESSVMKGSETPNAMPKPVSGLAAVEATKGTSVSKKHSEQPPSMPRTHKSVSVKDGSVMKVSKTPNAMRMPVSGLAAEQATKGTSVSKTHSEQPPLMPKTHKSVSVKDSSVMKGSETPNAMPKPVSGLAAVRATKGTSVSNKHSEQLKSMPRTQKSVLVNDSSVMKGSEIRNATPLVNESSGSLLKKRSRISSEATSMQKKAIKVEEKDAVEEVQPPKFKTKIAPVSSSAAGNNKEPSEEEVSVKDSSVMKGPNATQFEKVSSGSMSKKRSRISSEARVRKIRLQKWRWRRKILLKGWIHQSSRQKLLLSRALQQPEGNKEPSEEEVSVKDIRVMKGSEIPNVSSGSLLKKRSRISSDATNVQKKAPKLEEEDSVEKVQAPKIKTKVAPASIRRSVKVESSAAGYKEPSENEMYETVVDFLMEDDPCALSVSNILRKLGTHFGVNLRHRRAEVESIVDKFVFVSDDDE